MKRYTLELGGQCPLIVLDDADAAEAASAAARGRSRTWARSASP